MSIVVFLGLAVLVAGWILDPLWRGAKAAQSPAARKGGEEAPKRPPQTQAPRTNRACPVCGEGHEPSDRFCVHCGAALGRGETE